MVIHSSDETVYFQFYIENYLLFYQRLINFFFFLFKKPNYYYNNSCIIINHNEEKELKIYLETVDGEIDEQIRI